MVWRPTPRGASLLAAALLLGGAACDDDAAAELDPDRPLVDVSLWAPTQPEDDPLVEHRPATIDCPVAAWGPELGDLEIQTGVCNYLALSQPSLRTIEAGEVVAVDLWHAELDAAAPASGHFALIVDDDAVAELEVAIPAAPAVHRVAWTATRSIPEGATIGLHLHNHGFNTWTVVALRVEAAK
ncbi:MAG: hypothetical protein KC486_12275 [Myxococcales bacterium]|nr:hypothetical protein [Myxococcales bacterium]